MNERVLVMGAVITVGCISIAYYGFSGGGVPAIAVGIAGIVLSTIAAMGTIAIAMKAD